MSLTVSSVLKTAAVLGAFVVPSVAGAGEILLTSPDGTVSVRGEFLGFRESSYVVKTGDLETFVPAISIQCGGDDCFTFVTSNE